MTGYTRRVSFNERLYLAQDQLQPGFCIQIVVEGEPVEDPGFVARLEAAVAAAAQANPGSRLIQRGALGWMRWLARGPLPPVRVVHGFTPGSSLPAELDRPLSPVHGPTCEVVWAPAERPHLVFRCFHGVMDAGGLLHFAEDVFRALRGEAPSGAPSTLNDTEFVESLVGPRKRAFLQSDRRTITGKAPGKRSRVLFQRVSLPGPTPALVAKIAAFLARHAGQFHASPTRIMVPVDVRNYQRELRSTANLSYPLFLDVSSEQSWRAVQKDVLKRLAAKEPLHLDPAEKILPWLPMWLVRLIYAAWTGGPRRTGLYPFSALVTHLSSQGTAALSGASFRARSMFFLPVQSDFIPLTVSAVSSASSAELVVSAPAALFDEPRLAELCAALQAGISDSEAKPVANEGAA